MAVKIDNDKVKKRRFSYKDLITKNSLFNGLAALWSREATNGRGYTDLGATQIKLIVLAVLSTILYVLLFKYQDVLVHLAELTRQGERIDFLVPIAVAFVFSIVHGAFTSRFWDALGVKAVGAARKK